MFRYYKGVNKMSKNIRHGDLIFKEITKVPKGLEEVKYNGNLSLQEGEATGHHHILVADKQDVQILKDNNGDLYISVNGKAVMTHPEHKTIEIPKGNWKMEHEREHDYFANETRKVID